EHLGQDVGDVAPGHRTALELAHLHQAGGYVVGQPAGPDDGPVEVARAQVDLEDVVGVGVGVLGAHGRDHQVAAYAGGRGSVGQHHGGALVHGLLAGGVAVGSAAGGEDHGVCPADDLGQLL